MMPVPEVNETVLHGFGRWPGICWLALAALALVAGFWAACAAARHQYAKGQRP